jgi:hypothetical protein
MFAWQSMLGFLYNVHLGEALHICVAIDDISLSKSTWSEVDIRQVRLCFAMMKIKEVELFVHPDFVSDSEVYQLLPKNPVCFIGQFHGKLAVHCCQRQL